MTYIIVPSSVTTDGISTSLNASDEIQAINQPLISATATASNIPISNGLGSTPNPSSASADVPFIGATAGTLSARTTAYGVQYLALVDQTLNTVTRSDNSTATRARLYINGGLVDTQTISGDTWTFNYASISAGDTVRIFCDNNGSNYDPSFQSNFAANQSLVFGAGGCADYEGWTTSASTTGYNVESINVTYTQLTYNIPASIAAGEVFTIWNPSGNPFAIQQPASLIMSDNTSTTTAGTTGGVYGTAKYIEAIALSSTEILFKLTNGTLTYK